MVTVTHCLMLDGIHSALPDSELTASLSSCAETPGEDDEEQDEDTGPERPSYVPVRGYVAAPNMEVAADALYLLAVLDSAQLVAKPLDGANVTQMLEVCFLFWL